jgi:hypothetical protein
LSIAEDRRLVAAAGIELVTGDLLVLMPTVDIAADRVLRYFNNEFVYKYPLKYTL